MINLDTHILIHALTGDLEDGERRLLSAESWGISDIVLWEIAKLVQLGRLDLDLDDPEVKFVFGHIHVWPIDVRVARTSTRLDFRGDPADEIIGATSIVHEAPLVTRDRIILGSALVPLAETSPH